MNTLVMLSGYMVAFIFLVLWLWQKMTGAELVRRLVDSVEQLKTELRCIVAERATLYERINRLECKREHFEAVAKAAQSQAEDRRAAAAAEAERRRATEAEKAAARERERGPRAPDVWSGRKPLPALPILQPWQCSPGWACRSVVPTDC